jgi:hypothetical protein
MTTPEGQVFLDRVFFGEALRGAADPAFGAGGRARLRAGFVRPPPLKSRATLAT